jgi:hypothetical protein
MLSHLKSLFVRVFEWFLSYSHISNKYKLRLVGMLTCVFLCFNYVLLQIIKAKEFEPLIVELDKGGWLGSFVGHP